MSSDNERNERKEYVGLLLPQGRDGIIELDTKDDELGKTITIPRKFLNGAPFGMKVVAEYTGSDHKGNPLGKVTEVLGSPDSPDVAITGIIRAFGLKETFPQDVLDQVEPLPQDPDPDSIKRELREGREDFRDLDTLTIDGEDAKDLDDAIDIERLDDGNYRLYVHIADVAHYVREKSPLDQEAFRRGNSVYLVDRVLPMYPPKLSNGLCSLNPDKDRLAMTAIMDFDKNGKQLRGELKESVIRSKVRTSYNEVQALLDDGTVAEDRPDWFADKIRLMAELTEILNKQRRDRGALTFDFPETVVKLDAEGHPIEIGTEKVMFSNSMIESFMVAANEMTAGLAQKHNIPIVYRVHELPNVEQLQNIRHMASRFNHRLKVRTEPEPRDLADFIDEVRDEPYGETFEFLILRSLAKARYDTRNLGHFGLASEQYCHFTAPIRRYSDTWTHRQLKAWLHSEKGGKKQFARADAVAEQTSETERVAVDAERATVDQKAAEYYADRIGEVYPAKISGFAPASFFARMETSVEGAVFFRTLDGYFEYDPDTMSAAEARGNRILRLGDDVKVMISNVDINRRFIDLVCLEHEGEPMGAGNKDDKRRDRNHAGKRGKNRRNEPRHKKGAASKQRSDDGRGSRRRNKRATKKRKGRRRNRR